MLMVLFSLLQCWFYLNDVDRFFCVFLKKHHGGGVRVHAELLQQSGAVFGTLVHVAKAHKISEGKCRKLKCRKGKGLRDSKKQGAKIDFQSRLFSYLPLSPMSNNFLKYSPTSWTLLHAYLYITHT